MDFNAHNWESIQIHIARHIDNMLQPPSFQLKTKYVLKNCCSTE